ncbi:MAG: GNAT family N-acetyltransferase [Thermodesulfobacteriota bacterium]|nr:MAG: GNAT family N-acetyltransferase [Thermodesulfobacteriota bacterium]
MDIRVATRIEDIGISPEEWNRLLSGSETNTVFQTYEWFRSWWDVFGKENRLFLVSVFAPQGDLAGIVPLMLSSRSGRRTVRFIGDEKADYCDIISGPEKRKTIECVVEALILNKDEWDCISLRNIPEDSITCAELKRISQKADMRTITSQISCPTLLIAGRKEDAGRILGKKTLRRRFNYFKKCGELAFRHIRDEDEALRRLETFFEQHIKRRQLAGDKSLFSDPRNREFYARLTRGLLGKGWLLFSALEFNGSPIAFHFGFDYGSRVLWYKPSFDIEFSRRSPGQVMLMHLINYAIENGRAELDFTIGNEPFKSQFTNHVRMNTQLNLYRKNPAYLIDLSKHYILKSVKKTRK